VGYQMMKIDHCPETEIMEKQKYQLEFLMKTSIRILYNLISTPSGLAEWFCDDVNIANNVYTFIWDGTEEEARMLNKKRDMFTRFKWIADEEEGNECYFEFRIKIDDITNEVALIITDFVEEDEREEASALWSSQVENLKHVLGS
jgi:uncharacterized protein YndB with AHSA1/START domain